MVVLVFVERGNSENTEKASRSKKGINNKLYLHMTPAERRNRTQALELTTAPATDFVADPR